MEPDAALPPERARFQHEAVLCAGTGDFVAQAARYAREGLVAREAVLVAVAESNARALREELGADAEAVEYLDVERVGRNPARIIPAWQQWVERNTARGTPCRGIGEPIWVARSPLEIRECEVHEHLLNTAFTTGPSWSLLCPYDAHRLPADVVERVSRSHPTVLGVAAGDPRTRPVYDADAGSAALAAPLPELGAPFEQLAFDAADLALLRATITSGAARLGLDGRRLAEFLLVADELASNSIRHGGRKGRLLLWRSGEHAVCEVRDAGHIVDPLVGRRRPNVLARAGGVGLWSANQLCDLVLIHSTAESGTSVRAYLNVEP